MINEILPASLSMGRSPVACINTDRSPALVHHRIDGKARFDDRGNPFTFLVNSIPIQKTCANTRSPSALFKIKRELMCRLDSASGSESGANRFPAAGKTCEIMKSNSPCYYNLREIH